MVSVYLSASVTAGPDYLLAEWVLKDIPGIRGCLLYRFVDGAPTGVCVTPDTLRSVSGSFSFKDFSVEPGRSYAYLIVTYLNGEREEQYRLAGPYSVEIVSVAAVTAGRDYLLAEWALKDVPGIRGCLLYRFADGAPTGVIVTPDTLRSASGSFFFKDYSVEPGRSYAYLIVTYLNGDREKRYGLAGPYGIERFPFIADQNYPNPFARETTLSFFMPEQGSVAIDLYDVSGKRVARLTEGRYERGTQTIRWAPAKGGVAAGIYFCVFRTGNVTKTIKMIYVP
ncbi:MAG: T9SS type A sorting domain-containing protein [Candidatus Krumholzibacteria bacterium]|nr:T9SS type A sorting domain-containing protein [Candidatus Krumholzibacteria bacterium]